jgi:hypothetical protein
MLKQVAELIPAEAGGDGFVVIGGLHEVISSMVSRLHKSMNGRVHEDVTLNFDMSVADIRKATEQAASKLSEQRHAELVAALIDTARSGGRASLGREATEVALLDRRVEFLILSRELAAREPEYVDECVGRAFEQSAEVEEVGGTAGARLDAEADGIGARVRFTT